MPKSDQKPIYTIAIGASAGGLEALQEFLSHLPDALTNISIIVAQHLSPSHKSRLVELLSRETKLEVAEAAQGTKIKAGMVYITPPDSEISVKNGQIQLTKPSQDIGPKPSVNVLFRSLAGSIAENVIGVILSGTGSDGANGVKELKKAGGYVIVQEPETARYNGMPLAAIQTEVVDAVLSPEKMGEEILDYIRNPNAIKLQKELEKNEGSSLVKIFDLLSKRTGTDFSNYKSATIGRRLQKRMTMLKISSIEEYLTYVEERPEELDEMFNMILIGVTSFFRDKEAFDELRNSLKEIISEKTSKDPIRIWVPGCSTGEEAYTVAILLHEILKERVTKYSIQIFATDIDEKAISFARRGMYSEDALKGMSKETCKKYFIKTGEKYELIKQVKQMVLFSRHDVTSNPPFLKLDLITCRNLLIYFGAGLQQQIIPIFHYALNQDGILFLGKSETVGQFSNLFSTIDGKNKLYKRKRTRNINPIRFSAFKAQKQLIPEQKPKKERNNLTVSDLVKETLFTTFEHPYVVIDDAYNIRETWGDVRLFLTLPSGSMHANLLKMVNKELQIEVRSVVSKSVRDLEDVKSRIRKFELYGKEYYVRISAKPLIYTESSDELFVVIFEQLDIDGFVTKVDSSTETSSSDVNIQELEQELAVTKEHLQTYIEEIETSNEELQSLNEELQSTNEELQSSNEELETTNEELQSTNEEVQIAYSELKTAHSELEEKEDQLRKKELNQKALLDNKLQALFLVDHSYSVIATNVLAEEYAEKLTGRKLKQGDSIVDLTSSYNLQGLVEEIKKAFKGHTISGERKETDKNGAEFWFAFNITPVTNHKGGVDVISVGMIDITEKKEFSFKLDSSERLLHSVFNASASGICITDEKGYYVDVNREYCQIYGYERDELIGKKFTIVVPPEYREMLQNLHDDFIAGKEELDAEWTVQQKDGRLIDIFATARLLVYEDGSRYKVTSIKDITDNKRYRNLFDETQASAKIGGWEYDPINKQLSWTEEVYNIFELPFDTETDLDLLKSHFEGEAALVLQQAIDDAMENGDPFDIELVCKSSANESKWVRITANPVRVHNKTVKLFGILQNVTARIESTQLQDAEKEKYKVLFENSISALFITRPDGTILEANAAACDMFGYTVEEFRKLGRQGVIDPKSPELAKKLKQREETGRASGLLKAIRKNGEHFWCEFSSSVFEGPGGEKLSSVMLIDVSEKIEAQEKLEGVMSNATGVVFRYIMEKDGSDHLQFVSDGALEVWGFTPDEALKDLNGIWKNFHEDDVDSVRQSIRESAKSNSRWTSEYRYHHPDGSLRWCRGVGDPISNEDGRIVWDSIVLDISEEKQAELNLKLMESVVTGANDAVLITKAGQIEAPFGPEIIYVNKSFEKMTGYKADEVVGKTPRILQGPSSESEELKKLRTAIINEEAVEVELLNYSKSGEEYWVHISLNPIFENGMCTKFISIQRDITDRKLREIQKSLSSEISLIFNREKNVKDALQASMVQIMNLRQFDGVEFWQVDRDKKLIHLVAFEAGNSEIDDFYKNSNSFQGLKYGEGLPGKTWKKKESLFWKNLDKRKTFTRNKEAEIAGLKTAFSFPVMEGGEVIGVLNLLLSEDLKKERFYVKLFKELTGQIASEIVRKELEEELARIFNSAPDIICIAGFDGYYKKVNPAMSDFLGYSEEELLRTHVLEFVHPEDREKTIAEFENLNNRKGKHYFENRYITKSGKVVWLSWTTKPFYDEGITYSVAKDITEQKELEKLLEQANRLAKIGSWEVDVVNNKVYWSEITRQIHEEEPGFEPTLESGLNYYKQGKPRYTIEKAVDEALKNGTPWDLELPIITAKGNERWIRTIGEAEFVDGKLIRIYGSFQDIHAGKIAELDLISKTRHIEAIAKLNSALINYGDWFNALNNHLEVIGRAVDADRVYYFENYVDPETGKNHSTQKLEWCNEGIEPQIDNEDLIGMEFSKYPFLFDKLVDGKMNTATLSSLPENAVLKYIFESQQIKTFLAIPIYANGKFHGFMGFDNCTDEQYWSDDEITMLSAITSNLAVAIERANADRILEELYREKNTILESISDAFYAIDENWIITYFNHEAEVLLQQNADDVLGKSIWEVFDTAMQTDLYSVYSRVMTEKKAEAFEYYYPPQQVWYDISAYPAKNGISVYFKNINERKEVQEKIVRKTKQLDAIATFNSLLIKKESWYDALNESLKMFGEVTDADRVYFFESYVDEQGKEHISMIFEWASSDVSKEIANPNHQNVPVDFVGEFIDPLHSNQAFSKNVAEIKDAPFKEFLESQKIKSLLAVPVFVNQKFKGFIGFDDCKTERSWNMEEVIFLQTISLNLASAIENEDAEVALQMAFKEKNEILESIGDGFFAVDRNFTVEYWNHRAEELLFTAKENIQDKYLWDVFDKDIAPVSYQNYKKAISEKISMKFEDFYEPINRWFDVNVYPTDNGISVFFKDITERKKADENLKELNRTLEQQTEELAASNAELEQFAFVASHDLQEPLRMITGFLAQLEKKYDHLLDEKGKKYIYFATDGAVRMRQIIMDLLEYSRVGRIDTDKTQIDLNEVLIDATSLNRKLIEEKKADVSWETLPEIRASKTQMQQLFQNLINNALNYQKAGNKPVVKIRAEERDKEWVISVEDNGIGIDSQYSDKIFNIFQRLHGREEYSGTGVGLAICKKIVEDQGGKIWVESVVDKGSTFMFTLPKQKSENE